MASFRIKRAGDFFQPFFTSTPKVGTTNSKITSRSQKLLLSAGVIHQAYNGLFNVLPLGMRALRKLTDLVENSMEYELGAQKISFPSLVSDALWTKTGRKVLAGVELFKVVDRHGKEFILAPTHEESVTNLLATLPLISHKDLPMLLYQITNKYRDEMRPRFGLIRSKEFLMKDLYSFDKDEDSATQTYNKVANVYENIFNRIGIKFIKVVGEPGLMGGSVSHEYHFPADIGDDTLLICGDCQSGWNSNLHNTDDSCSNCGSSNIREHKGIEVGHTFMLGTKYSSPLKAQYKNAKQSASDVVMGSYGLGLTRILGAAVEMLSTDNEIRWPSSLAPFSVVIITPKKGSNETAVFSKAIDFYKALQSVDNFKDDVLLDDRDSLTIGRRINDARLVGYPRIIVVGKSATQEIPTFELHNTYENTKQELSFQGIIDELRGEYPEKISEKIYSL